MPDISDNHWKCPFCQMRLKTKDFRKHIRKSHYSWLKEPIPQ